MFIRGVGLVRQCWRNHDDHDNRNDGDHNEHSDDDDADNDGDASHPDNDHDQFIFFVGLSLLLGGWSQTLEASRQALTLGEKVFIWCPQMCQAGNYECINNAVLDGCSVAPCGCGCGCIGLEISER